MESSIKWLMRLAGNKFRLNPTCHPIPIEDTNLAAGKINFGDTDTYWEIELSADSYNKLTRTQRITIIHFHAKFDEQRFKSQALFDNILKLEFTTINWIQLEPFVKSHTKSALVKTHVIKDYSSPIPPTKSALGRYGFNIEHPTPSQAKIWEHASKATKTYSKNVHIAFEDVTIIDGGLIFTISTEWAPKPLQFTIFNIHLRRQLQSLKPKLVRAMGGNANFVATLQVVMTHGSITESNATSAHINRIDELLVFRVMSQ
jgi:hypothetical protein